MIGLENKVKILKKKLIFDQNWLLFLSFFLRLYDFNTANLSFIILALYSFLGPIQIIQSLTLCFFFTSFNYTFIDNYTSPGRVFAYLCFFSCLISILKHYDFKYSEIKKIIFKSNILFITILLGLFIVLHSILFSTLKSISLLKCFVWLSLIISIILTCYKLKYQQFLALNHWLLLVITLFVVVSVPIYLFFGFGLENGVGKFHGIYSNSQVMGILSSFLTTLLIGSIIEKNYVSYKKIFLLIFTFIIIFFSGSRISFFSTLFSFFLTLFFFLIYRKKSFFLFFPLFKNINFKIIILFFLLLLFIFLLFFFDLYQKFLEKNNSDVSNIFEAYYKSRSILFLPMIENIKSNFLTGIGFGVPSIGEKLNITYDPFFNIVPISSPTEKGVIILAVLEELGVVGFLIFSVWLAVLIRQAMKAGAKSFMIVLNIFFINLVEYTIFSTGSLGLISLILLIMALLRPTEISNKK